MVTRVLSLVLVAVVLASHSSSAVQNLRTGTRQVTNPANKPHRQFQQFQIGLQLPPGTQIHQGSQPPPAKPGFVWIQVPASPPPAQQGGYPQPPPPQQPQPPAFIEDTGAYPTPQEPGSFPPPSYPHPPPSYPAPAPVPPYPGNQPIRPDSDYEAPQGPGGELNPGQETGGTPPSPLLQYCQAARGQFPSPDTCSNFINCWDDTVVEQQCPGGLAFNVQGFCDYPENVDCSDRGGPNKVEASMEENASCPTPYGSYRSAVSCGIFYICDNGTPVKFECPEGLNYNTNLGVCDYPYRVDCGGTPSERPAPEAPAPEVPDYETPTSVDNVGEEFTGGEKHKYYGGLKQVPANMVDSRVPCRSNAVFRLNPSCSSVSVCRNGYSTVINCSTGTAWDSRSQSCINIYQARC